VKQRLILAAAVIGVIVAADIWTKRWALDALAHGMSVPMAGGLVPFTLAFNKGMAFGLPLPQAGRFIIIIASVVVLWILGGMYLKAERGDWLRLGSALLVSAGAIGNLIDRVRWDRGVVDFIGPINLGFMYWPIFNIADMAITTGAVLLGISLWQEQTRLAAAEQASARQPARPASEARS
jgi:signal peptidase II